MQVYNYLFEEIRKEYPMQVHISYAGAVTKSRTCYIHQHIYIYDSKPHKYAGSNTRALAIEQAQF